jgi:hypothetical protein
MKLVYSDDDGAVLPASVIAYAALVNAAGGSAITASEGAVGHSAAGINRRPRRVLLGPFDMRPSRRTQPYRKGSRQAGPSLSAMLRGRTGYGYNPMDLHRHMLRRRRRRY